MSFSLGHRTRWSFAAGLHVALMLALLQPLLTGEREPVFDARDMGYPSFAFLSHALHDGRVPLWDPYTNCGYPFYAEPGVVTSPLTLAAAAIAPTPALGYSAFWVFHWIVGGLGAMAMVAALGGGPSGGFAAAALYALSGFQIGNAQHTGFMVTAGWLPWAFAAAHAAVERRRPSLVAAAAVALALSALGGYLVISAVAGAWLALWLVLAFLTPLGPREAAGLERATRLRWVAATLVACAALLVITEAPALYAFFREGTGYTHRVATLARQVVLSDNPFTLRSWFTILFPAAGALKPDWFGTDLSMNDGYAGALAMPLAAVWLWRDRAPQRRLYLPLLGLLALTAAAGNQLPVREALYWTLPVSRFLRHNSTLRLFWILPLAAAAGCGVSWLGRHPEDRRAFGLALAGWAGVALIAGAALAASGFPDALGGSWGWLVFGPAALMLAIGSAAAWCWPRQFAAGSLAPLLALACAVDGVLHLATNSLSVWTEAGTIAEVERWPRVDKPAAPRQLGAPTGYMNAHQVVGVPVVEGYVTMLSDFNRVLVKGPFATVLASQRFWLAPGVTRSPDTASTVRRLTGWSVGSPVPALVDEGAVAPIGPAVIPGDYGEARIVSYQPELVEVEVEVPGEAGFLASTERYAAGWRVFVDGKEATSVPTNAYFRGVALPGGRHLITWRFDPGAFWPLVALAAAALLGTLAAWLVLWRLRR